MPKVSDPDPKNWKSAVDPKSGRTYYYNTKSKDTTWDKPPALLSREEQKELEKKRAVTLQFFHEMEDNIYRRVERARVREGSFADSPIAGLCKIRSTSSDRSNETSPTPNHGQGRNSSTDCRRDSTKIIFVSDQELLSGVDDRPRLGSGSGPSTARRVRTISTMDDEILLTMSRINQRRDSVKIDDPHLGLSREKAVRIPLKAEAKDDTLYRVGSKDGPVSYPLPVQIQAKDVPLAESSSKSKAVKSLREGKPRLLKRRNSTGTLYVDATMSQQDNDATIQCVCVVIRAHMIEAARENISPLPQYDVFKDRDFIQPEAKHLNPMNLVPSLDTVKSFFRRIFSKSQLESDCIIMALIYCERLVKETKGRLCIRYDNWKSILFACLVMASKVWDDMSMWNVDFSHVSSIFDLHRVNELELAMLECLRYVIRVSASEYAKYYFHLRSMMARLGLSNASISLKPLDLMGAKKLQLSTEKYQMSTTYKPRAHSMHVSIKKVASLSTGQSADSGLSDLRYNNKMVGLEQLIHAEHMDADGRIHQSDSGSRRNTPRKPDLRHK